MRIREAVAADRGGIEGVVRAAFGEHGGRVVAMVRALDESGATRVSLVADADGVVGHVQLSLAWVDARPALVEVMTLTPLSVVPGRHGEGIGTALLAAALEHAARSACPAVFLEGDPGYYGARGFGPAEDAGFGRPSDRIPRPAFQVALLPAHEPWMTGRLVYPDAIWRTDSAGLRDPLLVQVEARLSGGT